jgi:hypothetical protein
MVESYAAQDWATPPCQPDKEVGMYIGIGTAILILILLVILL